MGKGEIPFPLFNRKDIIMTHMSMTINAMTGNYSITTIDSAGRIITTYYNQNSSSIQKQIMYDPTTGESVYILGGSTINETTTGDNSRI